MKGPTATPTVLYGDLHTDNPGTFATIGVDLLASLTNQTRLILIGQANATTDTMHHSRGLSMVKTLIQVSFSRWVIGQSSAPCKQNVSGKKITHGTDRIMTKPLTRIVPGGKVTTYIFAG